MWSKRYFIAFFVSLFAATALTPLMRLIAYRLRFLDYPTERKNHALPIPSLGGVAVYLALLCGVFFTFYYSQAMKVILAGGMVILGLGVLDDKIKIPATIKVLAILIFAVILSLFGVMINFSHIYILDLLLTLFWILLITSAMNAVDNMDGLAAGLAAISSAFFFIAALRTGQYLFGIISTALLGAVIGFLFYNFKPAKIFLGNGGSFFLGFTLATIAIMAEWSEYPLISYIIPVLILIVPVFDLAFIILWRYRKGITKTIKEAILYSARDHLSHRLENLGLSQRRAVLLLYLLNICTGISAIVALPASSFYVVGFLLFQVFAIFLVLCIVINIGRKDLKRNP